jgi:hypothetical protein
MKTTLFIRLAILLLTFSTLSGCLLIPIDDGHRNGGSYDRGYDRHHGDNH